MGPIPLSGKRNLPVCCLFLGILFIYATMAGTVHADESNTLIERNGSLSAPDKDRRTTLHGDLITRLNPDGVMLSVGGHRRWISCKGDTSGIASPYLKGGFALGVNPAYSQVSVYGEWIPAVFAALRVQYDLYRFFGTNGALLSFPESGARFGKDEIDALKGKEESGFGHRIMLQPTLQTKAGPVIVRNQTDLAYYRFDGKGPFFYEWEYDTLLEDGDVLVANRTELLIEAWKGRKGALLLAGPYYEITRASEAGLNRQRAGGELFWVPVDSLWSLDRPRIYSQAGVNLEDRNRKGEAFIVLGIGFDFHLKSAGD